VPSMPVLDDFSESQLEYISSCPLCASSSLNRLFDENGFHYDQCMSCGLISLNPRIREAFTSEIYDQGSYFSGINTAYTMRIGEKRLRLLQKLVPEWRGESLIVEDGAGAGAFLAACRDRGYRFNGCDIGFDAVAIAKRTFNIDLHHGTMDSLGLSDASCGVIVGFNLLSHLYAPWDYAQHVHRLLTHDGVWLVRTGLRDHVMKRIRRGHWSAPEHVYHYNRQSFIPIAGKAGFEVSKIVPAFDSDFPYFLFDYGQSDSSVTHRLARRLASWTTLGWTMPKLPKDDAYILLRKIP